MRKKLKSLHYTAQGFSLIEVLISLAIMVIVLSVATQQVVMINALSKKTENRAQAQEDANLTAQYLTNEMRAAGGGS